MVSRLTFDGRLRDQEHWFKRALLGPRVVRRLVQWIAEMWSVLFTGQSVAGDEKGQVAPAAPQRADAGHAIAFAIEVSAQSADPQNGLFDSGRLHFGCQSLLIEVQPEGLPRIIA